MRAATESHGGTRQGEIRPWLLLLLRICPAHGYDLRTRLKALGIGADGATVYRVLAALERDGFVTADWQESGTGPARHVYSITAGGRGELDRGAREMTQRRRQLSRFIKQYRAATVPASEPEAR